MTAGSGGRHRRPIRRGRTGERLRVCVGLGSAVALIVGSLLPVQSPMISIIVYCTAAPVLSVLVLRGVVPASMALLAALAGDDLVDRTGGMIDFIARLQPIGVGENYRQEMWAAAIMIDRGEMARVLTADHRPVSQAVFRRDLARRAPAVVWCAWKDGWFRLPRHRRRES